MAARVQITTTVGPDGTIRLLEDDIEPAGIKAGDTVVVEVVRRPKRVPDMSTEANMSRRPDPAPDLSFDEWLERGRAMLALDNDVDVEELIRQGQEEAAREFWERFNGRT